MAYVSSEQGGSTSRNAEEVETDRPILMSMLSNVTGKATTVGVNEGEQFSFKVKQKHNTLTLLWSMVCDTLGTFNLDLSGEALLGRHNPFQHRPTSHFNHLTPSHMEAAQ